MQGKVTLPTVSLTLAQSETTQDKKFDISVIIVTCSCMSLDEII